MSLCIAQTAWMSPNIQLPEQPARGPGYLYVICIFLGDPKQILAPQSWVAVETGKSSLLSTEVGKQERVPREVHTGGRRVAQCGLSPGLCPVSCVTLNYSFDLSGHYLIGLLRDQGDDSVKGTRIQSWSWGLYKCSESLLTWGVAVTHLLYDFRQQYTSLDLPLPLGKVMKRGSFCNCYRPDPSWTHGYSHTSPDAHARLPLPPPKL